MWLKSDWWKLLSSSASFKATYRQRFEAACTVFGQHVNVDLKQRRACHAQEVSVSLSAPVSLGAGERLSRHGRNRGQHKHHQISARNTLGLGLSAAQARQTSKTVPSKALASSILCTSLHKQAPQPPETLWLHRFEGPHSAGAFSKGRACPKCRVCIKGFQTPPCLKGSWRSRSLRIQALSSGSEATGEEDEEGPPEPPEGRLRGSACKGSFDGFWRCSGRISVNNYQEPEGDFF